MKAAIDISQTTYGKSLNYNNLSLFMTEKEKYANNKEKLKKLAEYYDSLGRNQLNIRAKEINSLKDLAEGIINREDFIKSDEIEQLQAKDPSINFSEDDIDLDFYPIAPNIVNRLTGELDKKHLKFSIRLINKEATNEIIEQRNTELLDILRENIQNSLAGKETDTQKLQAQVMEKMENYSGSYRHVMEEWGQHVQNIENQKFNMSQIERKVYKDIIVHNHPFIHINYQDNHYYPEIWDASEVFYLKSKGVSDASDYTMIGKYSYIDFNTILNKYSLNEDQINQLKKWQQYYKAGLKDNNQSLFTGNKTGVRDSLENYMTFKQAETSLDIEIDPAHRLIRETYMYFLVPKKVGVLTTILNGQLFSTEVDETFKVSIYPKYRYEGKNKRDLISGEHVEWTYINELIKCLKLDMTYTSSPSVNTNRDDLDSIYIYLDKHDIQYKHKNFRYGIKIPVHGGSDGGKSIVFKLRPWQKFYNFVGNRSKHILSTEVGKFLLLNQNIIPQNSLDGEWGENNILKAYTVARDLSIMPTDPSLTNVGQLQAGAGVGQVVDLTKTQEILEKFTLMDRIKQEAYDAVGLNPTFMQDISPYQSARTVAQNQQTTLTQLQYTYSRYYDIMKAARETMIETALYLTAKGEMREISYLNSDQQRVIFNLKVENTLLYDLALYIDSDVKDSINLETLKQLAIQDNTMGSDAYEKGLIVTSESVSEVMKGLKEGVRKRDAQMEAQRKAEADAQQREIDARQLALDKEMENSNAQKELDRLNDLEEKRIAALGYANDNAATIAESIKDMTEFNKKLEFEEASHELEMRKHLFDINKQQDDALNVQRQRDSEERIRLEELRLRQEEINNARQRNLILDKKKDLKKK